MLGGHSTLNTVVLGEGTGEGMSKYQIHPRPTSYSATIAAMVAEVPCNLTPRHPPSQVVDNLPRYGG